MGYHGIYSVEHIYNHYALMKVKIISFNLFDFGHVTGDGDMENSIVLEPNQTIENRGDKSYLIVWQVNQS